MIRCIQSRRLRFLQHSQDKEAMLIRNGQQFSNALNRRRQQKVTTGTAPSGELVFIGFAYRTAV